MSSPSDSQGSENSSRPLLVMIGFLVVIITIFLFVILVIKPNQNSASTATARSRNLPQEHIEELDPNITAVFNLSEESRLFDELFDVLVYSENPDVNRIGDFVRNYRNFASNYPERSNSRQVGLTRYDTTDISFDRQRDFLASSVIALIGSIERKKKVFITIPVTYPVDKDLARIASGFGMRDHPILEQRRMHNGIDIAAPVGTEVKATASGKVIRTAEVPGYGRSCLIEHKFGYQTLYGHMVRIIVAENKWVEKGEVIGYLGNTGLSVAPHVHYEVRKNGKPLNPSYFIFENLSAEEYREVIFLGSKTNEILSF
jgi:murein DD-endopeptidase MepM/ murein hydrolase activator NlpD